MITLNRKSYGINGTTGELLSDTNEHLCYTLERPWDDNAPGKSCIPPGLYNCISYSSTKFPDVWQVCNVPGRDHILIHNGNTEENTEGCILCGDSIGTMDDLPAVFNSVKTLEMLKSKLPDIFELQINEPK